MAVESARQFLEYPITHYVIVSREDVKLFRGLVGGDTQLLVQEEVVQEHFWRVPGLRNWRFNWKTLPMRGWIWQQLVKLSIANRIEADVYLLLDSDCFFVRPFDPQSLMVKEQAPLFREDRDFYQTDPHAQRWAEVSRRLLRLPPWSEPHRVGYIGPLRYWRRDVLLGLQAYLSNGRAPTAWLREIARNLTFSECALYGIYVEQALGVASSGHYLLDGSVTHEYWSEVQMDAAALDRFSAQLPADKSLVMINARSRTPVADIRTTFGF